MTKNIFLLLLLLNCFHANAQSVSSFKEDSVDLNGIKGSLMLPDAKGKIPVVLIIAGSGPTDRNGNSIAGVNCNAYKMLADSLAKHGIASLRYDKRGIAASQSTMKSEADLRFTDYVNDANSFIEMLSKDSRFSKVIVVGHSEGSLIGMIAAHKADADAYISIAGAGQPADKVIEDQLKGQPQYVIDAVTTIFSELKKGKTVDSVPPYLMSLFRPSVQPYMISWIKYNPADEISKLTIPVLILQGTHDIQVSVDEAKMLSAAKPDAKLVLIEGMNHILKMASEDRAENIATYNVPDLPLPHELVQAIVEFIGE